VCSTITACTQDEFEISASSPGQNRKCAALTVCLVYDIEYESQPSTISSDRVCSKLSPECPVDYWQSKPPTYNEDRECTQGKPPTIAPTAAPTAPPTAVPTDSSAPTKASASIDTRCTLAGYAQALTHSLCAQAEDACWAQLSAAAPGMSRVHALCDSRSHCAAFRSCIFGALAIAHCTTTSVAALHDGQAQTYNSADGNARKLVAQPSPKHVFAGLLEAKHFCDRDLLPTASCQSTINHTACVLR
jgi:hypothetical protein